jgi:hypothetical protein
MLMCGALGALLEREAHGAALDDPDVNLLAGIAGLLIGFFGAWFLMLVLLMPGL